MQLVILAGGKGTRISEETHFLPKPLIEIGGRPIIWHIMKYYAEHGIKKFVICCGYKAEVIKEYFTNYGLHASDMTIDIAKNSITYHKRHYEDWQVTLLDTGLETQTGGRLKKISKYLKDTFCFTYGDGLANVNIKDQIKFHKKHKKLATMTIVKPKGRFGAVELEGNKIIKFLEKPAGDGSWINGGFFILEKKVLQYIKDDETSWEDEPLKELTKDKQLIAYKHKGFWHPMDTLRDKQYLEEIWKGNNCPWKNWNA
tara:strand:- start:611 stop:1381 length:771 start_codon:yes stop_codon:yes gene_type:complete